MQEKELIDIKNNYKYFNQRPFVHFVA